MHEAEKLSLDQIEAFLNASEEIRFEGENREQVYGWVEQVLRQQQYPKQGRKDQRLPAEKQQHCPFERRRERHSHEEETERKVVVELGFEIAADGEGNAAVRALRGRR